MKEPWTINLSGDTVDNATKIENCETISIWQGYRSFAIRMSRSQFDAAIRRAADKAGMLCQGNDDPSEQADIIERHVRQELGL